MDNFTAALTNFSVILGIVTVVGGALAYIIGHDHDDPRRLQKRVRIGLGTVGVFLVIIGVQYFHTPQSSLLTYVPGVPFPGSTLAACHITVADLMHASQEHAIPPVVASLAGATLKVGGSSVFTPLLQPVAGRFDAANGTHTVVTTSNSGEGLDDIANGLVAIGVSEEFADPHNPAYSNFVDHQIGVIAFTLVVSADLKDSVHNLTTNQITAIFTGKITNWHDVGGPDEPITVVNRQQGSGTRFSFEEYVLGGTPPVEIGTEAETTQELVASFQHKQGAISYIATNSLTAANSQNLFPICIDQHGALAQNVLNGTYDYWSLEHAYTNSTPPAGGIAQTFLNFLCGADFKQKDLQDGGFILISQLSAKALATHPLLSVDECSSSS